MPVSKNENRTNLRSESAKNKAALRNTPEAIKRRRESIIRLTAGTPMTLKEMESALGVGYYTLRTDVLDMCSTGEIRETGTSYKGAYLYSSKSNLLNEWPILWRDAKREVGWNLREAATEMLACGFISESLIQHFALNQQIFLMLCRANDTINPPVGEGSTLSDRDLKKLRTEIIGAINTVQQDIFMFQNLINSDMLWTKDGLQTLTTISNFPGSEGLRHFETGLIIDTSNVFVECIKKLRTLGKNRKSQSTDNAEPTKLTSVPDNIKESTNDSDTAERLPESESMDSDKPWNEVNRYVIKRVGNAILTSVIKLNDPLPEGFEEVPPGWSPVR
jgi:hypothetical protein